MCALVCCQHFVFSSYHCLVTAPEVAIVLAQCDTRHYFNEYIYFRSYDRSSRSLDQESPSKKKKFQTNYASTTHLLAGKKVPSSLQTKSSDVETTVFYIPGVDVKVK